MSTENLKNQFANWLLQNAPDSYSFYLGSSINSVEEKLNEINSYFPEMDLFKIEDSNPERVISFINNNIANKKARLQNPAFAEYDKKKSNGIPKAVIGKRNYIKFLKEYFPNNPETNYWIFQGNPNIYDIGRALKAAHLRSWKVAAHKDKIKPGDKVILWQTGNNAGCYALAEVISGVGKIAEEEYEKQYYREAKSNEEKEDRVKIKIIKYLADDPVLWEDIKDLAEFENFKAGNQGTNFSATKKEFETIIEMGAKLKRRYWLYSPGENAEFWEEFYEKQIMGLGWDYLGDLNQYSTKKEIEGKLQDYEDIKTSKKNDATANHEFKKVIATGDIVIAKKGRSKLLGYGEVISEYYYDEERKTFQKCRKVDWKKKGIWKTGFPLALKTLTDITNYPEDGPQYNQYYEKLLGIINDDPLPSSPQEMIPLNKILYGPPGTGKTYKLQHEYFEKYTVRETSLSRKQYLENLISELTWWQVITVAMVDLKNAKINDLYEHELIKIKEGLSKSESIKQTLWGQLQTHTKMECEHVNYKGRSEPLYFWKDKNTNWTVDEELVREIYPEAFSILEKSKSYTANPDKQIKNYEFITFHQSFSYEDFVEGIKPKLEEQETDLSYEIKDGIFKKLCLRATADPDNQYALFIDEINRGNISSIFGELITLIEDDKRMGQTNALSLKLPYSKLEFSVPANLHVIGTMNTADRSVEALDTALRRRFIFEEIMPLPQLLREITFKGFNLEEVLETINSRIEALLDRDHTIGHSYLIKIKSSDKPALQEAFENRIIPLLQEYFYHDYEKIALILGEGFVERNESKVQFANFNQLEDPEILSSFELIKEITDIEAAIRKLLNHNHEEA